MQLYGEQGMFAVFFHGTSEANCVRNGSVMLIMLCSGKPDLSETCWLCGSKITETSVEEKARPRRRANKTEEENLTSYKMGCI
jgi:hypothetical protein